MVAPLVRAPLATANGVATGPSEACAGENDPRSAGKRATGAFPCPPRRFLIPLTVLDRLASRFLADRGLRGVKLVIADDHKGLRAFVGQTGLRPFDAAKAVLLRPHLIPDCLLILLTTPGLQRDPSALSGALDAQCPGARSGQAAHGRGGDAQDDLRPGKQGRGRSPVEHGRVHGAYAAPLAPRSPFTAPGKAGQARHLHGRLAHSPLSLGVASGCGRPSWRSPIVAPSVRARWATVRAPLATARHGSSCSPTWGLRPFDALTRPHRGHGRVSLPQTVPRTVCRFADRRELPREHWTQIASTNPLERVNREIKRRTDVVGFGGKTAPHAVFLSASLPNDEAIIVPGAYAAPQGPRSPSTVGAFATGLEPVATSWLTARDQRRMDRRAPIHEP